MGLFIGLGLLFLLKRQFFGKVQYTRAPPLSNIPDESVLWDCFSGEYCTSSLIEFLGELCELYTTRPKVRSLKKNTNTSTVPQ